MGQVKVGDTDFARHQLVQKRLEQLIKHSTFSSVQVNLSDTIPVVKQMRRFSTYGNIGPRQRDNAQCTLMGSSYQGFRADAPSYKPPAMPASEVQPLSL